MQIYQIRGPYVLIGGLFLLLFPFPESQTTFSWNSTCDALHLPLFFVANYICIQFLQTKKITNAPAISSVALFLIGTTIEILQPYFGRGFSFKDIFVNFLGILLSYLFSSQHLNKLRLIRFSSIFAFLFVTLPIIDSYLLYKHRISNFPVLFNPDTKLIEVATSSYKSKLEKIDLNCGLKILPSDQPWSGVKIDFGYTNWSEYNFLKMVLSNPIDTPTRLGLRIDDNGDNKEYDSRYNDTIDLPANQTITIELPISQIKRRVTGKEFNLESIERALIFPLNSATPFCIGKIELKK